MHRAITQFDASFIRIQNLDALYLHLVNGIKLSHVEVSDILRSELVYAISAFDKLIHELVKTGMVESFLGTRIKTNAYLKYQLSMEQLNNINNPGIYPPEALFEQYVMNSHGHLAFQDPIKVSDALSLIWPEVHKWNKIALCVAMPMEDVKITLKNIVIRRNQIVHESDLDLFTGIVQPILYVDIATSLAFIKNLGHCIYNLVK